MKVLEDLVAQGGQYIGAKHTSRYVTMLCVALYQVRRMLEVGINQ